MTRTARGLIAAVVPLSLLLVTTAHAAGTPAAACAAAKQKAATKAAAAKTKCHSKALTLAVTTDPACLLKADGNLQKAFAAAEAKGGCAITGDVATVAALVDTFVDDLLGLTPLIACPGGQIVGGFCWYAAPLSGADCDSTCAAQSMAYDDATRTYAGSDGTDANCAAVATAFGHIFAGTSAAAGGMGCYQYGPGAFRDPAPTTSTAVGPRFCACH